MLNPKRRSPGVDLTTRALRLCNTRKQADHRTALVDKELRDSPYDAVMKFTIRISDGLRFSWAAEDCRGLGPALCEGKRSVSCARTPERRGFDRQIGIAVRLSDRAETHPRSFEVERLASEKFSAGRNPGGVPSSPSWGLPGRMILMRRSSGQPP